MKLIDKDALVAEITKIYDRNRSNGFIDVCDELDNILSFLDTSEVKEVDLDEEYKVFVEKDPVYNQLVNGIVGKFIAKHFFELGFKAQKGE